MIDSYLEEAQKAKKSYLISLLVVLMHAAQGNKNSKKLVTYCDTCVIRTHAPEGTG
jgi:hypothetical protein